MSYLGCTFRTVVRIEHLFEKEYIVATSPHVSPASVAPMRLTTRGRRVVVVRVFVKKTQKTPPRELEIARQRAKEII